MAKRKGIKVIDGVITQVETLISNLEKGVTQNTKGIEQNTKKIETIVSENEMFEVSNAKADNLICKLKDFITVD